MGSETRGKWYRKSSGSVSSSTHAEASTLETDAVGWHSRVLMRMYRLQL